MAKGQRKKEYKVRAVKLAREIGAGKAAKELGFPTALYGRMKAARERRGRLNLGAGTHTPDSAMSLAEERRYCASRSRDRKKDPAVERRKRVFGGSQRFFRRQPLEVSPQQKSANRTETMLKICRIS